MVSKTIVGGSSPSVPARKWSIGPMCKDTRLSLWWWEFDSPIDYK